MKKLPKILFFVVGPFPTAKDFEEAEKLNAMVVFRNALAVPAEQHSLEICDGVAGKVPAIYAKVFPNANAAIEQKEIEIKKVSEKTGDVEAPKPKAAKQAIPQWSANN